MMPGVIDFYSPAANGCAVGFFVGILRSRFGKLTIKRNGVVLLRNDPAKFNRTSEFSEGLILKISKSGGFCLLLCFVLGYERPAQYHFLI
jgi:hypothetical protein